MADPAAEAAQGEGMGAAGACLQVGTWFGAGWLVEPLKLHSNAPLPPAAAAATADMAVAAGAAAGVAAVAAAVAGAGAGAGAAADSGDASWRGPAATWAWAGCRANPRGGAAPGTDPRAPCDRGSTAAPAAPLWALASSHMRSCSVSVMTCPCMRMGPAWPGGRAPAAGPAPKAGTAPATGVAVIEAGAPATGIPLDKGGAPAAGVVLVGGGRPAISVARGWAYTGPADGGSAIAGGRWPLVVAGRNDCASSPVASYVLVQLTAAAAAAAAPPAVPAVAAVEAAAAPPLLQADSEGWRKLPLLCMRDLPPVPPATPSAPSMPPDLSDDAWPIASS